MAHHGSKIIDLGEIPTDPDEIQDWVETLSDGEVKEALWRGQRTFDYGSGEDRNRVLLECARAEANGRGLFDEREVPRIEGWTRHDADVVRYRLANHLPVFDGETFADAEARKFLPDLFSEIERDDESPIGCCISNAMTVYLEDDNGRISEDPIEYVEDCEGYAFIFWRGHYVAMETNGDSPGRTIARFLGAL